MLEFRAQDRPRVASGEITVTYRLWARAGVSAGRVYETRAGRIEVLSLAVMPAAMIPASDVPLSGCDSIAAIRALAGDHKRVTVADDTMLHRVEFRRLDSQ